MNTKTKSPVKSVTVWGAVSTTIFGLLSAFGITIGPEEIGAVGNAFAVIISFGITVYGRIRAKVPVKLLSESNGGILPCLLMTACVAIVTLPQVGCSNVPDAQKEQLAELGIEAGKIAATALINQGLRELGVGQEDLRPWIMALQETITFADQDSTPEQLANLILQEIYDSDVPIGAEDIILEVVLESLDNKNVTASSSESIAEQNYIEQLSAALQPKLE